MPPRIPAKMVQAVSAILSRMRTRRRSARELREDTRCLRRIIGSESGDVRRILELYFIEKASVVDIAIQLDLSPVAVREHLLCAIQRFEKERSS